MALTPRLTRIEDAVRDKIGKNCGLTEPPTANVRSQEIEEYVEHNSWKVEALKRAKGEAEKGEFISHQAMGRWIKSLGTDNELQTPEIDVFKAPV